MTEKKGMNIYKTWIAKEIKIGDEFELTHICGRSKVSVMSVEGKYARAETPGEEGLIFTLHKDEDGWYNSHNSMGKSAESSLIADLREEIRSENTTSTLIKEAYAYINWVISSQLDKVPDALMEAEKYLAEVVKRINSGERFVEGLAEIKTITVNKDILHGHPSLTGHSIYISTLLGELAEGHSVEDVEEDRMLEKGELTNMLMELALYFKKFGDINACKNV